MEGNLGVIPKYPYPTPGGMNILIPPPPPRLASGNSKMLYSVPP